MLESGKEFGPMFQRHVDAHLKTFALRYAVPNIMLETMTDEHVSHLASRLVFGVVHRVYCAGENETDVRFTTPATWADAFKEHYMSRWPRFITRHWTVKHKTIRHKVTARALLPDVPVMLSESKVRFVIWDDTEQERKLCQDLLTCQRRTATRSRLGSTGLSRCGTERNVSVMAT